MFLKYNDGRYLEVWLCKDF